MNQSRRNEIDPADPWLSLLAGEVLDNLSEDDRSELLKIILQTLETTQDPSEIGPPDSGQIGSHRGTLRYTADLIGLATGLQAEGEVIGTEASVTPLSEDLVKRIRRDAPKHLPDVKNPPSVQAFTPLPQIEATTSPLANKTPLSSTTTHRVGPTTWLGWCVAAGLAAVCVGLVVSREHIGVDRTTSRVATATDMGQFRRANPQAIEVAWTIKDKTETSWSEADGKVDSGVDGSDSADSPSNDSEPSDLGSVVWDNASQSGLMRIVGLPVNDVAVEQYQLWILDPARDDEPIDGGVFNIESGGESLIPIRAKLDVIAPIGFAITVEKPGGVVVSDQSRLPLLAMVP